MAYGTRPLFIGTGIGVPGLSWYFLLFPTRARLSLEIGTLWRCYTPPSFNPVGVKKVQRQFSHAIFCPSIHCARDGRGDGQVLTL